MPLPREPELSFQTPYHHIEPHAEVTADTTTKVSVVPAGWQLRLDSVSYLNPTGLATDASNFFNIKITDGTNVAASWSTETGQQGTIAANTFVSLVMTATLANRVFNENEVVTLFLDETGTATLPAGRVELRGRWIKRGTL